MVLAKVSKQKEKSMSTLWEATVSNREKKDPTCFQISISGSNQTSMLTLH